MSAERKTSFKQIVLRGFGTAGLAGAGLLGLSFEAKPISATGGSITPSATRTATPTFTPVVRGATETPTPISLTVLAGADARINFIVVNGVPVPVAAPTPVETRPTPGQTPSKPVDTATPTATATATATATMTNQQILDNQRTFLQAEINRLTREKASKAEIKKLEDQLDALRFPPTPTPTPTPTATATATATSTPTVAPTPARIPDFWDSRIAEAEKDRETARKQEQAALINKENRDTRERTNAINGTPTSTPTPTATGTSTATPTATATLTAEQVAIKQKAGLLPPNTPTPLPENIQRQRSEITRLEKQLNDLSLEKGNEAKIAELQKRINELKGSSEGLPVGWMLGSLAVIGGATYILYRRYGTPPPPPPPPAAGGGP